MSIKIDDMAAAIAEMLGEYQVEITKNIDASGGIVGGEGAKKLKETSPKLEGDYAKGWEVTREKGKSFGDDASYIIHNKTDYQLTHLLENGHDTRNGGRTKPIVHIKPVEELVIKEFEKKVEEVIRDAAK